MKLRSATLAAIVILSLVVMSRADATIYQPTQTSIADRGTSTSTLSFLGKSLKMYAKTNYLADYGQPAFGIIDPIGYVGIVPPLIRSKELIGGSISRPVFGNDIYLNNPNGNFDAYEVTLYFPADAVAVALGIKSIYKPGEERSPRVSIQTYELVNNLSMGLGAAGTSPKSETKTFTIGVTSARRNFLISPKQGGLLAIDITSQSPFSIGRLGVLRASDWPNNSLSVRASSGFYAASQSSYVALGDSFSSGEGAGIFNYSNNPYANDSAYHSGTFQAGSESDISDTPYGCHRAKVGWVYQLASANTSKLGTSTLRFAACSGARSIDFLMPSHDFYGYQAPQFTSLSPATKLVTLSIGVNDIGFSALLSECGHLYAIGDGNCRDRVGANFQADLNYLSQRDWQAGDQSDPTGVGRRCHQAYPDGAKARNNGVGIQVDHVFHHKYDYLICNLGYRLADLYVWIARLAPNAKIYVVGYPSLFTACTQEDGKIVDLSPDGTLDPRIDCADMTWLNGAGTALAAKIQSEVNVAIWDMARFGLGSRLTFIDSRLAGLDELNYGAPDHNDFYANSNSICPVIFEDSFGIDTVTRPESFHPNESGQFQLFSYYRTIVKL